LPSAGAAQQEAELDESSAAVEVATPPQLVHEKIT
jgi:hypothetical protein